MPGGISSHADSPGLKALVTDQPRTETSTTDVALLTIRMARAEEAAFREFQQQYFDRLLAYLLVVSANEQVARDALQSTLIRVARHVRRFDSADTFWSWLTVLARSALIDEQRKTARYVTFLDRFFHHQKTAAGFAEADGHELGELLEARLETLSEEDRKLIELKYFERMPVREIACCLQTTEKAVESRLVRIRQLLRRTILTDLKHET